MFSVFKVVPGTPEPSVSARTGGGDGFYQPPLAIRVVYQQHFQRPVKPCLVPNLQF